MGLTPHWVSYVFVEKGALVPDTLVKSLLFEKIDSTISTAKGFLFDGFPRNHQQCVDLENHLTQQDTEIHLALLLVVPEAELVKRMRQRGRKDDTEDVIRNRFQVYESETQPVVNYYNDKGFLQKVDGTGTMDEIAKRLEGIIQKEMKKA